MSTIKEAGSEELDAMVDAGRIRNFSIIAHIDHGKSTLADSLLQTTGNINAEERKNNPQMMDTLQVERERGITVKAQTATMVYTDRRKDATGEAYMINMIDTPGHVDFSYEVSRSLACCEGALLLVDSTQSIQAQTLDTYGKAKALGLKIVPVITKTDLPNADPVGTAIQMSATFGVDPDRVIATSAKLGEGIEEVLQAIIDDIPPPSYRNVLGELHSGSGSPPFLARIVDSWFDRHRGVVCLIQCLQGRLEEGQRLTAYAAVAAFEANKLGLDAQTQTQGNNNNVDGAGDKNKSAREMGGAGIS